MIEIVRRIAHHSDFLHNPPRTHIRGHGKCNDFVYPQRLESMMQHSARRLGCQALSPVFGRQAPSDLHAWCEVRVKRRYREPGESDEFLRLAQFGRKKRESAYREMLFTFIRQLIALRSRKNARKELHNPRIGIHAGKRFPVRLLPGPQPQTLRLENSHSQYASVSIE